MTSLKKLTLSGEMARGKERQMKLTTTTGGDSRRIIK